MEADAPPHFSLADALEVVEGDAPLLEEMARTFLRLAPSLLESTREGLQRGDSLQVSRNLRDLEERAASVGALALQEGAHRLQAAFTQGGFSAPSSPLENLVLLLEGFRESFSQVDWEELDDGF